MNTKAILKHGSSHRTALSPSNHEHKLCSPPILDLLYPPTFLALSTLPPIGTLPIATILPIEPARPSSLLPTSPSSTNQYRFRLPPSLPQPWSIPIIPKPVQSHQPHRCTNSTRFLSPNPNPLQLLPPTPGSELVTPPRKSICPGDW